MTPFLSILEEASTILLLYQTTVRHGRVRKATLYEEVKTNKRSFQTNGLSLFFCLFYFNFCLMF